MGKRHEEDSEKLGTCDPNSSRIYVITMAETDHPRRNPKLGSSLAPGASSRMMQLPGGVNFVRNERVFSIDVRLSFVSKKARTNAADYVSSTVDATDSKTSAATHTVPKVERYRLPARRPC